jgi:sugar phosphate isomerase/epimerase
MKLGFLTRYSEEMVEFAGDDESFECLEIFGPPEEWIGNSAKAKSSRNKAKTLLDENDLTIASFLYVNFPQLQVSRGDLSKQLKRLDQLMDACNEMGVAVVTGPGPMGYDRSISLEENVARYKKVYSNVAKVAEDSGVKIAFENWPGAGPFAEGASLSITPEAWGLMFDAVPSKQIGLEFDPSHLLWQWIDPFAAFDEFCDRVYVLHAKDTEIFEECVKRSGVFGKGWWRYRLPGFAKFDWRRLFAMAHERGYEDAVIIEHEDPVFDDDRRLEGFHRCGQFLKGCILD